VAKTDAETQATSVWPVLFVVGTAFMASRYDFQLSTLALPQFQDSFGYDNQTAIIIGTLAKVGAIPAVALTFLADRIGRKPLFLWAIIGFSLAAILVAVSQNAIMLTLGLFLTRLFTMVDELLAVVLLAEAAPAQKRAFLLALMSFLGAAGDGTALLAYGLLPISLMRGDGCMRRALYRLCYQLDGGLACQKVRLSKPLKNKPLWIHLRRSDATNT
jgi:MFS family permease